MNSFKKNALLTLLIVLIFLALPLSCFADGLNPDWTETNDPEEAAQLFEKGREAFEMGRISDAILHFDKAVQKNAQYAVAWLYKALTVETDADRKSSIDKAVLLRNNATKQERILIDIEVTYMDNNSEQRFNLAEQLVELQPENARALLILAGEYQNRDEISKFRDLASEAIRVNPYSPLGYRALAASWLLNEPMDFSLAESFMKKFVELRPNEASAHIALGDVYRVSLNLEKAKAAYSKAIEIDPLCAVAMSKRGYVYTYLGMFDEARADFKRASALDSHMMDLSKPNVSMFSYLFSGNGKVPANEVEMINNHQQENKRVSLKGDSDNCYFCCTFISMLHGFVASPQPSLSAFQCLRHELEMESRVPDETTIESNIAFIKGVRAIQQNNDKKAKQIIRDYARSITPEIKPKKNEAYNFLAGLLQSKQGNYSNALVSFKRSDTGNIFVKYNMGLVYDKLGMYEEAKNTFEEVAEFHFANARNTQMVKFADAWLKVLADTGHDKNK